jgi:hypothetical protein
VLAAAKGEPRVLTPRRTYYDAAVYY